VRFNGRVFEAVSARLARRRPCALYHSALVARVPEGSFVIEMAPVGRGAGALRGVVAEGVSRSGLPVASIRAPQGGRAPGWDAGLRVAARPDTGPAEAR
jgi:hypothetical protein